MQGISLLTVSLTDNGDFQRLCVVVERIAHLPDRRCHHEPLLYLLRILAHHLVQLAEDGLVLLGRIPRRAVQTLFYNREAIEHLGRDVQCQHGHEDDIHKIDHLLARGNLSLLNSHSFYSLLREDICRQTSSLP